MGEGASSLIHASPLPKHFSPAIVKQVTSPHRPRQPQDSPYDLTPQKQVDLDE